MEILQNRIMHICIYHFIYAWKIAIKLILLEAMSSGLLCISPDINQFNLSKRENCGILADYNYSIECSQDIYNYLSNGIEHLEFGLGVDLRTVSWIIQWSEIDILITILFKSWYNDKKIGGSFSSYEQSECLSFLESYKYTNFHL